MYIGEEPETEFMGAFGPKKHRIVPGKALGHKKFHGRPQELLPKGKPHEILTKHGEAIPGKLVTPMGPEMQFMGEEPEEEFLGQENLKRDAKKGYCGKNPTNQFMGEDEPEVQFLSASKEFEETEELSDDGLPCPNAEGYCGPPPTEQFMGAIPAHARGRGASAGRGLKRGHHKGEPGGPPGLRGAAPHETAEVPDEPEEQFMGEAPPELHFPPFMGGTPEQDFLGGDLLVIEGLDQAVGPYEPDYRPDLVPWVTKPSTNHFAAYRQGAKYWGPGAQYEPGFQKEQRLPSTDDWHTNAMEGLGDLGLHSEAEQKRALQVAENHFRKAIDALRKGNKAIYHENLGFLRGVRRLAELEGAGGLMRSVEKMIRELR